MKPNPQPKQQGPKPFAQDQQTPNSLMTCPAIEAYHEAKEVLDEFCERTDADRKRFNTTHDEARNRVFAFVNENLIHEATVFEVQVPNPEQETNKLAAEFVSVFYLVEPRNTEIKRVDFIAQTGKQPESGE